MAVDGGRRNGYLRLKCECAEGRAAKKGGKKRILGNIKIMRRKEGEEEEEKRQEVKRRKGVRERE